MHILFISEYFPPLIRGGGEINLNLLTQALSKKINVSVLTSHQKGLKRFEEKNKVKIYRALDSGENPDGLIDNFKRSFIFPNSVIKQVKKIVKKQKIDAIHFIGTSVMAATQISKLNIPLFATIESYPALCPKGDRIYWGREECKIKCSRSNFFLCQYNSKEIGKMKNRFWLKYNLPLLEYIFQHYKKIQEGLKHCQLIAISEYIQKVLLQHGLKSKVIPNAINLKDFNGNKIKDKNEKKTKKEKLNILYLGSLIKSKGPHILLEAIDGLNVHCDLYGEGNMKEELQKTIIKKGLDSKIHSPVSYKRVPSLYQNTDIVVFPSLWPEPFGRISIEAMATGKPIIGSKIGGIKETIKNGFLVQPGNIPEMRKALQKLINSPHLRRSLALKGKKQVKEYQEEKVIKEMVDYYGI